VASCGAEKRVLLEVAAGASEVILVCSNEKELLLLLQHHSFISLSLARPMK
jgi:hypothetical protein